jgi:hypothetical protein
MHRAKGTITSRRCHTHSSRHFRGVPGYFGESHLATQRRAYLKALRLADAGKTKPLSDVVARAVNGALTKFLMPKLAGEAKSVPPSALAAQSPYSVEYLRTLIDRNKPRAIRHGRLCWVQGRARGLSLVTRPARWKASREARSPSAPATRDRAPSRSEGPPNDSEAAIRRSRHRRPRLPAQRRRNVIDVARFKEFFGNTPNSELSGKPGAVQSRRRAESCAGALGGEIGVESRWLHRARQD